MPSKQKSPIHVFSTTDSFAECGGGAARTGGRLVIVMQPDATRRSEAA